VDRLAWGLLAVVLVLAGFYVLELAPAGWVSYLVIGVGVGIGCAVAGSLLHDALTGRRQP
jgi:hypothetical protein